MQAFKQGLVKLGHSLHISFDSYSVNTKNINVTTLKIYVSIQNYTTFSYPAPDTSHNTLFPHRVKNVVQKQASIKQPDKDKLKIG